jgi:ribosomal protein S18 acetylase RimI-like enzyme
MLHENSGVLALSVRVARPNDVADLREIIVTSFYRQATTPSWLLPLLRLGLYESLKQHVQDKAGYHIVFVAVAPDVSGAANSDQVVGLVEMSSCANGFFQLFQPHYPYLSNLAVRSDYRRQGVAQTLLRHCEERAQQQGFHQLYLHVLEGNQPARQLYSKSGYQPLKIEQLYDCWFLGRSRRLLLHKSLKPTL